MLNNALNKCLNLEYGNFKANLDQIKNHERIKKKWEKEMQGIAKVHAIRHPKYVSDLKKKFENKGYCYLGNVSCTKEFAKVQSMIKTEMNKVESVYGPNMLNKLRGNQGLPRIEERIQRHFDMQVKVNGFPSIRGEIVDLVPETLTTRVCIAGSMPYYGGSMHAWEQINIPHRPWLHRDGYPPIGYKVFILCHDTDLSQGPMNVYSKWQSRIISILRTEKHKLLGSDAKDRLFKQTPFKLTGKKGDAFLVDPNRCLHSEGELDTQRTRTMIQIMYWPYYIKKRIQKYTPKPKPN